MACGTLACEVPNEVVPAVAMKQSGSMHCIYGFQPGRVACECPRPAKRCGKRGLCFKPHFGLVKPLF